MTVPTDQNPRQTLRPVPPVIPVILAGGAGNRLWPLSRQEYPKQLIALLGERSLVQDTVLRFADRSRFAAPLVVTSEAIRFTIADQLQAIDIAPLSLVLEPVGRGTAPAVAIAALLALEEHAEATIVVAPSDHAIRDVAALHAALDVAVAAARQGLLVTFSIPPSRPETGYGYMEHGSSVTGVDGAFRVASFVEKPDAARAAEMISGGRHFWNSGMFIFGAAFFLAELERHAPEILDAAKAALAGRTADLDFLRLDAGAFGKSPSDSIDYAVMERTERAATVPLRAGWSDVGAWSELWAISERDADGNHRFLGYVLETGGARIYHSGDTVFFDGLVEDVKPLAPDVVLLPVNGSRPELSANGVPGNLSLDEAIDIACGLGADAAVFHHYGMFAFNTVDPRAIDAAAEATMQGGCETKLLRAQTGREYRVSQS